MPQKSELPQKNFAANAENNLANVKNTDIFWKNGVIVLKKNA